MRLCMFHPLGHPMERGWVGRLDGENVIHLAAQTLQSFFTGGASAREHAVYPLANVCLLTPVLHPPAVRVFESETAFEFANPAAITGPNAQIQARTGVLALVPRIAAIVGADGTAAGFTACADWRSPGATPPKDRDFAFGLGPVVATRDAVDPNGLGALVRIDGKPLLAGTFDGFDWAAAVELAALGTVLRAGDVIAGPGLELVEGITPGSAVELEVDAIGTLGQSVVGGP